MIIHASAKFAKRLKCQISIPEKKQEQPEHLSGWSADVLQVYRWGQIAVMMNDASLATVIVPLKGIRDFDAFLPVFLAQAHFLFKKAGVHIDFQNQNILVLRRNNRRLIGTMNDAIKSIQCDVEAQRVNSDEIDWLISEEFVNETPFSLIGYMSPMQRLKSLA